jgi:uncharacterized membrane protein SpoIIM required for sporulation
MEWILWFQFGSGLASVFGVPVYLVLGSVAYGYYLVINTIGFFSMISVQWFDTPVEENGNLDQEKEVFTFANFVDYPLRKYFLYDMLATLGLWNALFPVANLWTMPALGLAAYYNELY